MKPGRIRGVVAIAAVLPIVAGAAGLAHLPHRHHSHSGHASDAASPAAAPSPPVSAAALLAQLEAPAHAGVIFIGDGATSGDGAGPHQGYAALLSDRLGWSARIIPGGSRSGYVASGPTGTFAERLETARPRLGVQLVVVAGSRADLKAHVPAAEVAATLPRILADIRSNFGPLAKVLVVGPYPTSDTTGPSVAAAIDRALADAAASAGVAYLSPLQQHWLGRHPLVNLRGGVLTQSGHDLYARRLRRALS